MDFGISKADLKWLEHVKETGKLLTKLIDEKDNNHTIEIFDLTLMFDNEHELVYIEKQNNEIIRFETY